ncbi:histone H2Bv [Pelobates cultripes]|uniref:Histone H2Bv n=1 Tax=Pelobates cultripes TaxID=61616 RepID=A0AAD1VV87_PELCU|nr:histone H2Bv [Pelobates cultripes]CAH2250710.1 histone H2Bv [Pelobates cultripes]
MENLKWSSQEDDSFPSTSNIPQIMKRRRTDSFVLYIRKVMKEVNPDLSISSVALELLETFIKGIFELIARQAGRLVRYKKKHTLSEEDLEMALCFLLHGKLAKYAMNEGNKAIINYKSSLGTM